MDWLITCLPTTTCRRRKRNDYCDSEDLSELVVHLDPVPLRLVLDTSARPTLFFVVADDFTDEPPVHLAAEKGHDIFCTEAAHGVVQQLRVEIGQGLRRAEHDIGGQFGLLDAPVVTSGGERVSQQRIDDRRDAIQRLRPTYQRDAIGDLLGFGGVVDGEKCVLVLTESDAGFIEFSSQPIVAVHANLDGHREPGLDASVHEAKDRVDDVKVIAEALASGAYEPRSFLAAEHAIAQDGFVSSSRPVRW